GTPVTGVATDILGVTRGVIPDIGAYEFPTTIGFDHIPADKNFICYPNPFSDRLKLILNSNSEAEISIYNSQGAIKLRQSFMKSIELDTENLTPGIYFYSVRSGGTGVMTGKLIKL